MLIYTYKENNISGIYRKVIYVSLPTHAHTTPQTTKSVKKTLFIYKCVFYQHQHEEKQDNKELYLFNTSLSPVRDKYRILWYSNESKHLLTKPPFPHHLPMMSCITEEETGCRKGCYCRIKHLSSRYEKPQRTCFYLILVQICLF